MSINSFDQCVGNILRSLPLDAISNQVDRSRDISWILLEGKEDVGGIRIIRRRKNFRRRIQHGL